jgi:Transcriptional regulator
MLEKRLELFLAVAMSRNFAKAAEMLNVTPSSVSKELKNLEDELGMLLVDRQKGVKESRLTPAGEAFLPLALKWQEVNREIKNSRKQQQMFFLSVAGCEAANNNLLPRIFNDMLNHAPPVLLKVLTDPTDMLYEKVETREVDVAFMVHREASRLVRITPMFEDEMLVARYCEESSEADMEIGMLCSDELDPFDELYIEWSQEFRLWHHSLWDPTVPLQAQLVTAYLVPSMMNSAGRWSIVPKCVMRDYKRMEPRMRFYRLNPSPPPLTFYHVTHRTPKFSAVRGLQILEHLLLTRGFFKDLN